MPNSLLGRPQKPEIDLAILNATIKILADVGFDALSIAAVARRAHTTTPAIYRRFNDKTELVIKALQHELKKLTFHISDQGSLRSDLVALTNMIAKSLTVARVRIIAALFLASREHSDPANSLISMARQSITQAWDIILIRAYERGEIDIVVLPQELLSQVIPALILNSMMMLQPYENKITLEQLVDLIVMPILCQHKNHIIFNNKDYQ